MMKKVKFIHKSFSICIIVMISLICAAMFSSSAFAEGCKPTTCPKTCSASSSTNCGKTLDANCITKQNKGIEGGSCFNNVPVTGTDSVSSKCSGESGESGTNFPVSNASSDDTVYAKAAADGKVVYAGITEDGGRTVIIEHTKGCSTEDKGDSEKYHSIYRHLFSVNVSYGQNVSLNDIIGVVGGSTATEGGSLCDNKSQAGKEGYQNTGCGSAKADDIHLNFEVFNGPASGSASSATSSSAMDTNCAEMQNFCGGCSGNLDNCLSEQPIRYHETSSESLNVAYKDTVSKTSAKASCKEGLEFTSETCTFCGLFKDIYNAASSIAKKANDGLAGPTKRLVGIGFMIWLAIFVLRNITSFGGAKISEIFKGVLFQGFRVAAISIILGSALYQVMDLTINPILQTGLSFSRSLNTTNTCDADAEYLQGIIGYDSSKGYKPTDEGALSKQVGIAFVCSIKKLEDGVAKMMSYGDYSICLSFKDFPTLGFVPHAGFLTTGAFLYIVGAALLICFPWFLIDCLLQLCITVALLPCAIGAFAFKITSKYLKVLWSFFMNSMFNFVFVSIVIFIITANFKTWLGYDFDANDVDPNLFINATGNGLAWWGTSAFRILGVCFFCFIFLSEAKQMSERFASSSSGGGKGIGVMAGGLAASASFSAIKGGVGSLATWAGVGIQSAEGQAEDMSDQAKGIMSDLYSDKNDFDSKSASPSTPTVTPRDYVKNAATDDTLTAPVGTNAYVDEAAAAAGVGASVSSQAATQPEPRGIKATQTTNSSGGTTSIYQDADGTRIAVSRDSFGEIKSIESQSENGQNYSVSREEFNEDRLEDIAKKLEDSPQDLKDISNSVKNENQAFEKWESEGKPQLKAEQGSLIRKVKEQGNDSTETLIDSSGDRMVITRDKASGQIKNITMTDADNSSGSMYTHVRPRGENRADESALMEAFVIKLKNSPDDMDTIRREMKERFNR